MTSEITTSLRPYTIPNLAIDVDFEYQFEQLCMNSNVNPVSHGEFEEADQELITVAQSNDDERRERCRAFVIQRSAVGERRLC